MFKVTIKNNTLFAYNENNESFQLNNKKFFIDDIIDRNENLIHSHIQNILLVGIINPTKAKYSSTTSKQNSSIYQIEPFNKNLPKFLISLKKIKNNKNRFIIFSFDNWNNVIPIAKLHENLGPIENKDIFIDKLLIIHHQLNHLFPYKKNIDTITKYIDGFNLNKKIITSFFDYSNVNTFSIDPPNTEDIDDTFSFINTPNSKILIISITDVTEFINKTNLINAISCCSTLYSNNRYDIFPNDFLANTSLFVGQKRNTISLLLEFNDNNQLIKEEFIDAIIVNKNQYTYDQVNQYYQQELNDKKLNKISDNDIIFKYIYDFTLKNNKNNNILNEINDFKDIVAYWMIYYNHKIAIKLNYNKLFPCRKHNKTNINEQTDIPKEVLFRYYSSAFYQLNKNNVNNELVNANVLHSGLNTEIYTHASSPIRRINDVLIQIIYRFDEKIFELDINNLNIINNIINYINFEEKKIKKFHNKINLLNKISVLNNLYKKTGNSNLKCMIININNFSNSNKIELFNQQYNLFFNINIIDQKIIYLYNIDVTDNYLIISKKNDVIYQIKLYDVIDVEFIINYQNIIYPIKFFINNLIL